MFGMGLFRQKTKGMSSHQLSCILLHAANNILLAGLEERLKEGLGKKKWRTSSAELCKITTIIICGMWGDIKASIESMETRYCCHSAMNKVFEQCVARHNTSDSSADLVSIIHGKHGRMLIANGGVGKGSVVLRERPFACNIASKCHCSSGVVLTEHVNLAWMLFLKRQQEFNKASRDGPCDGFDNFITSFQSGLCDDVLAGDDSLMKFGVKDVNWESANVRQWAFRDQCLMITISAICALYSRDKFGIKLCSDRVDIISRGNKERDNVVNVVWMVTQIISRLPSNCHAIHRIVSTSARGSVPGDRPYRTQEQQLEQVVEQQRLGFAIFLRASACNHSCRPNAAVRFVFDAECESLSETRIGISSKPVVGNKRFYGVGSSLGVGGDSAVDEVMNLLRRVCLEVIPVCSVASSSELCISYGPMAGAHALATRQAALRRQYLFQCRCAACEAQQREQEQERELKLAMACDTSSSSSVSGDGAWDEGMAVEGGPASHARRVTQLCEALGDLRLEARVLNAEVTEVLNLFHLGARDADLDTSSVESTSTSTSASTSSHFNACDSPSLTPQGRGKGTGSSRNILASFERMRLEPTRQKLFKLRKKHFGIDPELLTKQVWTAVCGAHRQGDAFIGEALPSVEGGGGGGEGGGVWSNERGHRDNDDDGETCSDVDTFEGDCALGPGPGLEPLLFPSGSHEAALFKEFCDIFCSVLDISGHVAATRGEFGVAAELVAEALHAMVASGMYADDDVVVARERVKLAQLLLSCGRLQVCRRVLERAMGDLGPLVPADDPDYAEAALIMQYLST